MLRLLGRVAEGSEKIESLAAELQAAGAVEGVVAEEQAESRLARGQRDEAAALFCKAWQLMKDDAWLKEGEPERWERLRSLAGE